MKPVLLTAIVLCSFMNSAPAAEQAARSPNIVFILADDLGYADINAYAARASGARPDEMFYETPNLDRLAGEGLAFSQAYACQLCSPTRAGLLTGKFAARIGVTTATPGSVKTFYNQGIDPPEGYLAHDAVFWGDKIAAQQALFNGSTLDALPAGHPLDQGRDETTIAEALTGYQSAFLGKWHLGSHGADGWQPHNQGFEELAYVDEGGSPYFNWRRVWDDRKKKFPNMPQAELIAGKAGPDTGETYLTDSLTQNAVDYLKQRAAPGNQKPFFLYLCHVAVHTPFQAKPEDIAYFEKKSTRGWNGHTNAVYAAMVRSLDESVGLILRTLDETGLAKDTIVVFMSDNGGVTYSDPPATCNAPLKGGKAMMFEGGIRVPLMFRMPGTVPAGRWCDVPVDYTDLFPTLLDVAGRDFTKHYPCIDGRSLVPLFKDPSNTSKAYPRTTRYWHYPFNVGVKHPDDGVSLAPHSAIREGDFKLIFDWSGKLLLYDLKADPGEKHDLSEQRRDLTESLFGKLNAWIDENVAVKYTPMLNPNYDPAKESRPRPFVDLRAKLLGDSRSIRSTATDPRVRLLEKLEAPPGIIPLKQ